MNPAKHIRKLMSPKIDFVFKLIFGDQKHKDITIGFLTDVLHTPEGELADIEIINSELLREYKEDKKGILDVRAKTKGGQQINIEIQILPTEFMPERTRNTGSGRRCGCAVDDVHRWESGGCYGNAGSKEQTYQQCTGLPENHFPG